jgi:hypothetical protein
VAIGFKKKAITAAIQGGSEVLLYKVAYANKLIDLPPERLQLIDAIFSSTGTPGAKAIQSFAKERWAIKPIGFSEEQECRLIVTIDSSAGQLKPSARGLKIGYYASSTEVREYCDFEFDDKFIESITLGPNNRTNEDALRRHLADIGFGATQINRSAISYR